MQIIIRITDASDSSLIDDAKVSLCIDRLTNNGVVVISDNPVILLSVERSGYESYPDQPYMLSSMLSNVTDISLHKLSHNESNNEEEPEYYKCGILDGVNLVSCVYSKIEPDNTPEGAFEVTKRVAWLLRDQGWGLLKEVNGVIWKSIPFSASRICNEQGYLVKLLSDVLNKPVWLVDPNPVNPDFYIKAIDPDS